MPSHLWEKRRVLHRIWALKVLIYAKYLQFYQVGCYYYFRLDSSAMWKSPSNSATSSTFFFFFSFNIFNVNLLYTVTSQLSLLGNRVECVWEFRWTRHLGRSEEGNFQELGKNRPVLGSKEHLEIPGTWNLTNLVSNPSSITTWPWKCYLTLRFSSVN